MGGKRSPYQIVLLFSEKADKLLASSAATAATSPFSSTYRFDQGTIAATFDGPDGEQIDAFVLTLRFFIQDNEPTSLRNMRKLYEEIAPSPLSAQFASLCEELNTFLDKPTFIQIDSPPPLTHREIFEAFVFGDLAHANTRHRALFEVMRRPLSSPMFKGVLGVCLRVFTSVIADLNGLNKTLLQSLGPTA